MTDTAIGADEVARYLHDHPEFFEQHAELLGTITLPHPHGGRAISLQERQLEVLRERHRLLELKLAELIRIGEENDAIGARLQKWTRQLLLAGDPDQLPDLVVDGLGTIFSVPQVALRLWGLRDQWAGLECAQPVPVDVITLTNSMTQPFCGPNSDFQAATWLPDGGRETRSIALLPLRKGVDPKAFGLLVLGSADPDRFRSGMGTAYLERIGEMASAALSRLAD
ncbi:DUF484 family protein [Burkholderiaceae bacterium FT117]|uniref:DUF484 family protein n=1 Tax=Zeimonas sediminis TaxID=2944268 RepID=UPI002342BE5E|nr:DUF484 family protein [Zeimonas sediminis]MCM5571662.1 DUF484 family protein [Zeimonas sediminis]